MLTRLKNNNAMKRFLTLLTIALSLVVINHSCKPEPELPGSIYGIVTDKATGEPVKTAGVELSPLGLKTVTGSEGQFEFTDLEPGNYQLYVTKTGYTELVSSTIVVKSDQTAKGDVQIEKLPAALKVLDDKGEDLSELDFGNKYDDVSRMFNIFNDGPELLNYEIVKTASWITNLSVTEGELKPGATKAVVVTIDRDKLSLGENTTTLQITSNNGNKQLTITVEKLQVLNVVDNNGKEINELDFGSENDLSRTFNIVNNGGSVLSYQITKSVDWISSISSTSGKIDGGGTLVVVVTIDRVKLPVGDNSTTIHITTDKGNKQLAVKAKKNPAEMLLVDNNGKEISKLDFSTSSSSMTFNIFNNGYDKIDYHITKTVGWIESISNMDGTVDAGAKKAILVTINRKLLPLGDNSTMLQLTSDVGSKQLEIKCNNGSISTSEATEIKKNSAKLNASVTANDTYTEKGFYFGKNSNTSTKYVVAGNNIGNYYYEVTGLGEGETYFYKAYIIHNNKTYYGDLKEFTTKASFFIAEGCGPGGCDLYVDMEDLGTFSFATDKAYNLGGINVCSSEVDGMINMNAALSWDSDLSEYPAMQACYLKGDGWYLPSKSELENLMNKYPSYFSASSNYWTSTQYSKDRIYYYDDYYETTHSYYSVCFNVRAVKRADDNIGGDDNWDDNNGNDDNDDNGNNNEQYTNLSYGFETGSEGWTAIDNDGDGYNWGRSEYLSAHSGIACLCSNSYVNIDETSGIALTPDNYLISPVITATSASKMSFWACAQDEKWPSEHFGVAVSTDGNTFTTIAEWTIAGKSGSAGTRSTDRQTSWKKYEVDLSSYAGKQLYVAIRHFNCTDMYMLLVDDIEFYQVETY